MRAPPKDPVLKAVHSAVEALPQATREARSKRLIESAKSVKPLANLPRTPAEEIAVLREIEAVLADAE